MQNFNLPLLVIALILGLKCRASDSLAYRTARVSIKYNTASLVFHGADIQAEYILSPERGIWTEAAAHRQAYSELNSSICEKNFLAGMNFYKPFRGAILFKPHNGVYAGPYLKYRQGYFCDDRQADYKAMYVGLQSGIQSISKNNLVFCMGMGLGIGRFLFRNESAFHTFYDYYRLPFMDFRATIALGYLF